jgi:hypothetical protein
MKNLTKITLLFLAIMSIFSCSEDEEPTVSTNTTITITITNSADGNDQYSAFGVVNEGIHPVFENNVISFEFNQSQNVNENKLLLTIDNFSNAEIELFDGIRTLSESYIAGGELDTWGAGATVWDESGNSTIYSKVDRGVLQITRFSETRVSGNFMIDFISRDETKTITITGDFSNISRESF